MVSKNLEFDANCLEFIYECWEFSFSRTWRSPALEGWILWGRRLITYLLFIC